MTEQADTELEQRFDGEWGSDEADTLNMVGFRCTDIGNGERLVARYRGRVHYCFARKRWLIWDGKRWRWDPGGVMTRVAKRVVRGIYQEAAACPDKQLREELWKHAQASERANAVLNMLKMAESEEGIAVDMEELDADPMLLNCENGTINLRTGTLHPHRREDLITKLCPVEFSPGAEHPVWERFLSEATNGDTELRGYIQRAAGYALQGAATERALFFVYGAPGSAKSTLIDALGSALGDYHVATSAETWLIQKNPGGNRGDLVRLAGARLVTATEFQQRARFDEALLKSVTGGDTITAAAKYEAEVSFRPSFALWFAANDAPAIRDDDAGMWARMRRIPFDHVIPAERQDKTIKERLKSSPECRAAVLAWAVAGCTAWQVSGLGMAKAIEASNREYQAEMDPVGEFFDDRCAWGAGDSVGQGEIRKGYERWAKEVGVQYLLDRKQFEKRVISRGGQYVIVRGKRYVRGLRLLGDWEEKEDAKK